MNGQRKLTLCQSAGDGKRSNRHADASHGRLIGAHAWIVAAYGYPALPQLLEDCHMLAGGHLDRKEVMC